MEEEIIDTTTPGFTDTYTFINKAEAPVIESTKVSRYIAILTGKVKVATIPLDATERL